MSTAERKKERFWNQLLALIASRDAVPIVGEEMLQTSAASPAATLYHELATQYAEEYGIELEDALKGNLSATVRRHPNFFTKPLGICQEVAEQYSEWEGAIPEPLLALAKIRHLNLFVSTTFDNLLERAINQERFEGKERTVVITYAPNNIPSDQTVEDALSSGRPIVIQLFGSCKTPGQYALTEADMVEYIHSLETNQKRRFVTELYERTILLLGNSFPDWLTRILLRLARNKPLDDGDQKPVYIADSQVKSDPRLKFFLRNFVANTEVVDESTAAEFVDELSRRWVDQFGGEQAEVAPITPPGKTRPMPKNAVFISYCRSDSAGKSAADAQSAFAIRDGLEARGVEVWLDRDQLQGGDDYERKIKRYIETSSLFIPLISETTDARDVGFFRKEWSWAIERLPYFTGSDRQFLIPVVLGPEDWHPLRVPAEFAPMHYVRLSSGQPDSPFLDRIQSLYEQIRGPVR